MHSYLPVCPQNTCGTGHMHSLTKQLTEHTQKTFASPSKNTVENKTEKKTQEISDDLSVCLLNILLWRSVL